MEEKGKSFGGKGRLLYSRSLSNALRKLKTGPRQFSGQTIRDSIYRFLRVVRGFVRLMAEHHITLGPLKRLERVEI